MWLSGCSGPPAVAPDPTHIDSRAPRGRRRRYGSRRAGWGPEMDSAILLSVAKHHDFQNPLDDSIVKHSRETTRLRYQSTRPICGISLPKEEKRVHHGAQRSGQCRAQRMTSLPAYLSPFDPGRLSAKTEVCPAPDQTGKQRGRAASCASHFSAVRSALARGPVSDPHGRPMSAIPHLENAGGNPTEKGMKLTGACCCRGLAQALSAAWQSLSSDFIGTPKL